MNHQHGNFRKYGDNIYKSSFNKTFIIDIKKFQSHFEYCADLTVYLTTEVNSIHVTGVKIRR